MPGLIQKVHSSTRKVSYLHHNYHLYLYLAKTLKILYILTMLSVANHIKQVCLDFASQQGVADISAVNFEVAVTKDISKGDLYTNFALAVSNILQKNPIAIALELSQYLETHLDKTKVEKVEVVGGYVNFWLVAVSKIDLPKNIEHKDFTGKKIAYEYTDPNPMKEFHIGHLMSNTIGECLSRLGELAGAEVKRYSYQGDTGRHIAVTLWGVRFLEDTWPDEESISVTDKVKFLGRAYVAGNNKLAELKEKGVESDEYKNALLEVEVMNKKVYERTDNEVNVLYDQGKEWSLEKFEELYDILGTSFDQYFFESQSAPVGKEIVLAHPDIFTQGENGAIIFEGEKYDLHTRVFINKTGIPTYEGKELGLTKIKYDAWPYDFSYVITANEQNEVFKVTAKAISLVMPEIGQKIKHAGHGMMKLVGVKMSSRSGQIVAGDELVEIMMEASIEKMKERDIEEFEQKQIATEVAVAAIKFNILKQNFRKDIIFDKEKALALDGDSGPYVQYTAVRIQSVLKKVEELSVAPTLSNEPLSKEAVLLNRTLMRFEHVCYAAIDESAPQHVAQYLIDLASKFNGFYANNKIITEQGVDSRLVQLCGSTFETIKKGLWILGIKTVKKM